VCRAKKGVAVYVPKIQKKVQKTGCSITFKAREYGSAGNKVSVEIMKEKGKNGRRREYLYPRVCLWTRTSYQLNLLRYTWFSFTSTVSKFDWEAVERAPLELVYGMYRYTMNSRENFSHKSIII
jgi:hypothetical protein